MSDIFEIPRSLCFGQATPHTYGLTDVTINPERSVHWPGVDYFAAPDGERLIVHVPGSSFTLTRSDSEGLVRNAILPDHIYCEGPDNMWSLDGCVVTPLEGGTYNVTSSNGTQEVSQDDIDHMTPPWVRDNSTYFASIFDVGLPGVRMD
ncbi:hypothetical protein [Changpingibacter yushuensis]|uniref:hypothetical protein n=1 Tax=Changpingibacter yushuensis TaxID=2758440 RepID=UPI0015F38BA5|nr:hypothetical protein [Changpingibacter yushuensis]